MPVVRISAVLDLDQEQKLRLFGLITDYFVELGVPAEAVNVIIERTDMDDWAVGGVPLSVRLGVGDASAASG